MNIGRYEVIEELGQGGMAVVYLARDPYIKRQVAVKVLPRQFTFDPQFRARFQREAEVIAALEHPAIVPVYDFGEVEDQPFIVMRYMPGGTLADLLAGGPLPIPEIAALFERIGSALDHAHRLGVIHRDIKPGNILFDSQRMSYLSDFGIAKLAEASAALTGTGIIGTPAYMSPEQAQGEKNLDGRCDIYSLGVVLFQALTGELPYKADTPMGQAMAHIIEPVPSLLERSPDLPPTFERIIHKTLDKSPGNRYQTASQLAQAIHEGEKEPVVRMVPAPPEGEMAEPAAGGPSVEPGKYSFPPMPQPGGFVPPARNPAGAKPAEQPVPMEDARSSRPSAMPPVAVKRKASLPKLAGGISVLFLCLCAALIGGFASGLIPNPFANFPAQPVTPLASESPSLTSTTGPILNDVTQTILPPEESPSALAGASATPLLASTAEGTSTQSGESLLPYFTAATNMLCREGPGTDYVDRWQLNAGEIVQALAQWYEDPSWLLVDINVPATTTRTDCCWVGGQGTLNVSLDQIKTINFLPDRLDCSAVK